MDLTLDIFSNRMCRLCFVCLNELAYPNTVNNGKTLTRLCRRNFSLFVKQRKSAIALFNEKPIQWGSELIWYLNGCKEVGCQMVPFFECHLNSCQIDVMLFSYVLVWNLNGWSSTQGIAHRPTKSSVFKWSVFRSPHCSNFLNAILILDKQTYCYFLMYQSGT